MFSKVSEDQCPGYQLSDRWHARNLPLAAMVEGKPSTTSEPVDDMGWSSYVVPVVGSALVSTLIGLRATATRERDVVMAQLQDLPAWVQFPDTERVEWMNKVIHQLWPYIGEYAKVFMADFIIPQVKAQMPSMFKNFKFTKMDMGDIPCRVGGIKVYTTNVGRDRIIVDMEVAYAGDADFTVSCCGFTGGMNNLQFSGKLRAVLKPLLPYPPMVGGVSGSFLEMPKIDFNLTGMGEMVELPGLMNAIRSVVNSQVAALCVLPNEIVVPLAPNVDVTKLFFPEPDGVIRLKIIEAKNLENRDISFIRKGKSDPYCEIQVGSQFLKTRTIDNDLNPVWNEYFEAVVDQAHGQKLRIELFDEDQGQDEELGRLSIELKDIQARGSVDNWFPLEGCKHGDLHLKATWMNLSKDRRHLEKQQWESEWLQADKPIHPALLMVYVDSVSDLPYPKSKLEPSPFVEVTLGKNAQRTPVKVKTVNPLYQSKFLFFVRHPEGQELKFEAIDDGTRRVLGSLSIPLNQIIKEPEMEFYQQTFMLTLGVHQCPIVLTVRLRGFVPAGEIPAGAKQREDNGEIALTQGVRKTGGNGVLDNDTLMEYANAVHIERAPRTDVTPSKQAMNGDSMAVEPAKTVNPSPGLLDPETKLNAEEITILRSESINSINTSSGRSSRLGRVFTAKHEKHKSRGNQPRGEVEMSIRYADATRKLVVQVLRAKQLLPWDKAGDCDPYANVKLISLENSKDVQKRKTAVVKGTVNPSFDNHFEFDVDPGDLHNYKLQICVKDDTNYGAFSSKPILGQIDIRLSSLDNWSLPQQWIRLEAERV
ncbi:C2 domain protein [Ancylostoma ceylanicum]|uniref:C2 domain protein n=1 Tax=Ancylostoma ceylanicum TaxID=53326 RepID=A0A0D6LNP0_9BILA|nr:C2 domain protein [Ancylostoma ceylanicum]